jgi:hypothetical protein
MGRFLFFTLLMLAMPLTVSAKIVPLINTDATLTCSESGLSLNSTLTQNYFDYHDADSGTLTISLGPLISGHLVTGGTFSSSGSPFVALGNPGVLKGIPHRAFTATVGGTSLINPEPGTLALLGTGFLGLAGIAMRSKMRRSNSEPKPGSQR